jgi:SHAQKYF class myb-like DNA-binding protein
MSENQKIVGALSGSKRSLHQRQELHSFHEPAAKKRGRREGRNDYEFTTSTLTSLEQTEHHPNRHQKGSSSSSEKSVNFDDVWSEEQHKHFVASIFEIGLKNASPAVILENMTQKLETITSERVKSKLQKYRSNKNKEKSKEEFMTNYCDFLQRIKSIQAANPSTRSGIGNHHHHHQGIADATSFDPILSKVLDEIGSSAPDNEQILLSGDVAGYLTYCVMKENKQTKKTEGQSSANGATSSTSVLPTNVLRKGARDYVDNYAGCAMQFPVLTDIEKKSSLGIAMTFIAGLFLTMSQHLTRERARAETIGLKLSSSAITTTTTTMTTTTGSISDNAANAPNDDPLPSNR